MLIPELGLYAFIKKPEVKTIKETMLSHVVDDEVFVQIEDSRNYISQYGRVMTINPQTKKKEYLIQRIKKNNDLIVSLRMKAGEPQKQFKPSRLVAIAFVENDDPVKKNCVVHKDGNRYFNFSSNLRWATMSEACAIGAKSRKAVKPLLMICPETGEVIDDFESVADASRNTYLHEASIHDCLKGRSKTSGGFLWKVDTEALKVHKIKNTRRKFV